MVKTVGEERRERERERGKGGTWMSVQQRNNPYNKDSVLVPSLKLLPFLPFIGQSQQNL